MYKSYYPAMLVLAMCLVMYGRHYCYSCTERDVTSMFMFSFCHANLAHLIANSIALVAFRPRWLTCCLAYLIAVVTAPLSTLDTPTMGLSVFMFAAVARRYVAWDFNIRRPVFYNVALLAINSIASINYFNAVAHLVAFTLGYGVWHMYYHNNIIIKWRENLQRQNENYSRQDFSTRQSKKK